MKKRIKNSLIAISSSASVACIVTPILASCSSNGTEEFKKINVNTIKPILNPELRANSPYLKMLSNAQNLPTNQLNSILSNIFVGNNYVSNNFKFSNINYNQPIGNLFVELKVNDPKKDGFMIDGNSGFFESVSWDYEIPRFVIKDPILKIKKGVNAGTIPGNLNVNNIQNYVDITYDSDNSRISDVKYGTIENDQSKKIVVDFSANEDCCFVKGDKKYNSYESILTIGNEEIIATPTPTLMNGYNLYNHPEIRNISMGNYTSYLNGTNVQNASVTNVQFVSESSHNNYINITFTANPGFVFDTTEKTTVVKIDVPYANYISLPNPKIRLEINSNNSQLESLNKSNLNLFLTDYQPEGVNIDKATYTSSTRTIFINYSCKDGYVFMPGGVTTFGWSGIVPEGSSTQLTPIYTLPTATIKPGVGRDDPTLSNLTTSNVTELVTINNISNAVISNVQYSISTNIISITFSANSGYVFMDGGVQKQQITREVLVPAPEYISSPIVTINEGINIESSLLNGLSKENYSSVMSITNMGQNVQLDSVKYISSSHTIESKFSIVGNNNAYFQENKQKSLTINKVVSQALQYPNPIVNTNLTRGDLENVSNLTQNDLKKCFTSLGTNSNPNIKVSSIEYFNSTSSETNLKYKFKITYTTTGGYVFPNNQTTYTWTSTNQLPKTPVTSVPTYTLLADMTSNFWTEKQGTTFNANDLSNIGFFNSTKYLNIFDITASKTTSSSSTNNLSINYSLKSNLGDIYDTTGIQSKTQSLSIPEKIINITTDKTLNK